MLLLPLLIRLDSIASVPGSSRRYLGAGKEIGVHFQDAATQIPGLSWDVVLTKTWYMPPLVPESLKGF